jgi:hypothetical protein
MDCPRLNKLFEECSRAYFPASKIPTEIFANEAQKYNCILLSNTIQRQCNGILTTNEILYALPVEDEK